jgi:hypothetical protein
MVSVLGVRDDRDDEGDGSADDSAVDEDHHVDNDTNNDDVDDNDLITSINELLRRRLFRSISCEI